MPQRYQPISYAAREHWARREEAEKAARSRPRSALAERVSFIGFFATVIVVATLVAIFARSVGFVFVTWVGIVLELLATYAVIGWARGGFLV